MSQNNVTHMIENPLLCDMTYHRALGLISVTRCVSTHICPRIILDLLYGICTNFTFYHTDCTRTDFTVYHRLYNECWLCTALCGIYTDFTLYRWLYNVHWLYSVPLTLHALTLPCTTDFTMCTDFTLYYVEFARTSHLNLKRFTQIELPAKLLDYFILSNKSNIKLYYWLLYTKIWGGYGQ